MVLAEIAHSIILPLVTVSSGGLLGQISVLGRGEHRGVSGWFIARDIVVEFCLALNIDLVM